MRSSAKSTNVCKAKETLLETKFERDNMTFLDYIHYKLNKTTHLGKDSQSTYDLVKAIRQKVHLVDKCKNGTKLYRFLITENIGKKHAVLNMVKVYRIYAKKHGFEVEHIDTSKF